MILILGIFTCHQVTLAKTHQEYVEDFADIMEDYDKKARKGHSIAKAMDKYREEFFELIKEMGAMDEQIKISIISAASQRAGRSPKKKSLSKTSTGKLNNKQYDLLEKFSKTDASVTQLQSWKEPRFCKQFLLKKHEKRGKDFAPWQLTHEEIQSEINQTVQKSTNDKDTNEIKLTRKHGFYRPGGPGTEVVIGGFDLGHTDISIAQRLAGTFLDPGPNFITDANACTFYFNRVKEETDRPGHMQVFNWNFTDRPKDGPNCLAEFGKYTPGSGMHRKNGPDKRDYAYDYKKISLRDPRIKNGALNAILNPNRSQTGKPSMLECLEKHGGLNLGCNGQSHRGPTEQGKLLIASGCKAETVIKLIHRQYGDNGVGRGRRCVFRQMEQLMGSTNEYRNLRERYRNAMGGKIKEQPETLVTGKQIGKRHIASDDDK